MFVEKEINQGLLNFIEASPTGLQVVDNLRQQLLRAGFQELEEQREWTLKDKQGYFVTRNGSALIAFVVPETDFVGYQLFASHGDSPLFKVKPQAELVIDQKLVTLNVEKYGGMILYSWLDRPLSLAGRVVVATENGIENRLINIKEPILLIPSLAIHMNSTVNEGYKFNVQKDMLPLFRMKSSSKDLLSLVAEAAGCDVKDILTSDLYLYNCEKGTFFGADGEFIAAPRLDDLQCVYGGLQGFLAAAPKRAAAVYCVLDNEEVGSGTRQGAASTFLKDVLERINSGFAGDKEEYLRRISNSLLLSADNAHSIHPNHVEKADPTNHPCLNGGIVLKYSANQKYTTDAVSGGIFHRLCQEAQVPVQSFVNRSDMLGGSTLGNISITQVPVCSVDIGLPQLAMHSAYETAGAKDTIYLAELTQLFFSVGFEISGKTIKILK